MTRKRIVFILVLLVLVSTVSRSAKAISIPGCVCYTVNVTPVVQAHDNWCWAACAAMTGKTLYPSTTRSQYSAAYHILNSYADFGANIVDSANATEYVAYNTKSLTGVYYKLGFYTIQSHIQNGYPVQAAAGYYVNGIRDGGHVVVIKGTAYDTANNSNNEIEYIDPYNGNTYCCMYSAFCDGSYNSRKYDQTAYVTN